MVGWLVALGGVEGEAAARSAFIHSPFSRTDTLHCACPRKKQDLQRLGVKKPHVPTVLGAIQVQQRRHEMK